MRSEAMDMPFCGGAVGVIRRGAARRKAPSVRAATRPTPVIAVGVAAESLYGKIPVDENPVMTYT